MKKAVRVAQSAPVARRNKKVGTVKKAGTRTVKTLFQCLSPRSGKKGHSVTLSFEKRQQVTSKLHSIVYKMGSIPHEDPPEGSYQDLFDYTNLTESVEMLLGDNPNLDVFLYKEVESLQVADCPVQFDVYHAKQRPTGIHPTRRLPLPRLWIES